VPDIGVVDWTDAKGKTYEFSYDALGRLRKMVFPSGKTAQRDYDDKGRVSRVAFVGVGALTTSYGTQFDLPKAEVLRSADGQIVQTSVFEHDAAARLTKKIHKLGEENIEFSYTYDGAGLPVPGLVTGQNGFLSTVTSAKFRKEFLYLRNGALAKSSLFLMDGNTVIKEKNYFVNGAERSEKVTFTDPSGASISYRKNFIYSSDGTLREVKVNDSRILSLLYDKHGSVVKTQFVGSDNAVTHLDSSSRRVIRTELNRDGKTIEQEFGYHADALLERRTTVLSDMTRIESAFTRDERDFLSDHKIDQREQSFAFDDDAMPMALRGESLTNDSTGLKLGTKIYSKDGLQRVTGWEGVNLKYNAQGQLGTAQGAFETLEFVYDENDQRLVSQKNGVTESISVFGLSIHHGKVYELLRNGNTIVGVLENGQFKSVLTDHAGSVLAVDGVEWPAIDAFGSRNGGTTQDLAAVVDFAGGGRQRDLNLVRMGQRDYLPELGMFTTPDLHFVRNFDALVKSPTEGNLFSYAKNDPVSYFDPTGRTAWLLVQRDNESTGGYGHTAIMFGNDTMGYYYAQSGLDDTGMGAGKSFRAAAFAREPESFIIGAVQSNPRMLFESIQDERNAEAFNDVVRIETSPLQDARMLQYMNTRLAAPENYGLFTNNCAHFAKEVLSASLKDMSYSWWPIVPNTYFDQTRDAFAGQDNQSRDTRTSSNVLDSVFGRRVD
jgi:RHS repeat-associated protein